MVSKECVDAVGDVSLAANQNNSLTENIVTRIESLDEASNGLSAIISQFKVSGSKSESGSDSSYSEVETDTAVLEPSSNENYEEEFAKAQDHNLEDAIDDHQYETDTNDEEVHLSGNHNSEASFDDSFEDEEK